MFVAHSRLISTGLLGCILLATSAAAGSPDIVVSDAKISGGKLLITGTAAAPLLRLRLDGRTDASFNATARADRSFSFSAVYLPKDCIVTLQRVLPTGALGEATDAVVANCSPVALTPRGAWNAAGAYQPLDLVSYHGSTWMASQATAGEQPGKSAAWQLFAAATADASDSSGQAGAGTGSSDGSSSTNSTAAATVSPPAAPSGPAGGDLAGNYPNPLIRNGAIIGSKIGTGAVTTGKIALNTIISNRIQDNAVITSKIAAGAVDGTRIAAGAVDGSKIASLAVDGTKIASAAVDGTKIAPDAIDGSKVLDFSLSNEDVGVLFAQINADGTPFSSSGGVTAFSLGTGTYEVDFGRNVSACAAVATQGEGGVGSAGGAIMGVTDRSGNANAYFITTRNFSGALTNTAFQVIVVC